VPSDLACFTKICVTLAQKPSSETRNQALQRGDGGYADRVIASIHGLAVDDVWSVYWSIDGTYNSFTNLAD
jgi:hypothetical protein